MSYTAKVVVKDGVASVTTEGPIPDGEFVITGHDDDFRRDLGVRQHGTDGRFVTSAMHSHTKEVS